MRPPIYRQISLYSSVITYTYYYKEYYRVPLVQFLKIYNKTNNKMNIVEILNSSIKIPNLEYLSTFTDYLQDEQRNLIEKMENKITIKGIIIIIISIYWEF